MSIYGISFILCFTLLLFVLLALKRLGGADQIYGVTKGILLLCSYLFLATYNLWFCCILFCYSCFVYTITRLLGKNKDKCWIFVGIFVSVLMLGMFKYLNFFLMSTEKIVHMDFPTLHIIVPLGISFYVFSAISYMLDIYWDIYPIEKNFMDVLLYLSFFPKIMAGPIVRPELFFSQLNEKRSVSITNIEIGIQYIAIGLFKKMVIADHLGVMVDQVFGAPAAFSWFSLLWCGAISYALQLYFDFSGYSEIAVGMAKCLGFDFEANFNLPYLVSKDATEYWRRWHISLGTWFRDYCLNPVLKTEWIKKIRHFCKSQWGKKAAQKIPTLIGMAIVWSLTGLWHGANYTYIIWGIYFLFFMIIELFIDIRNLKVFPYIYTPIVVIISDIIFRSESLGQAVFIIKRIVTGEKGIFQLYTWTFAAIGVLILELALAFWKNGKTLDKISVFYPIMKLDRISTLTVFFVFIGLIIIMAYTGNNFFIYGNF